MRELRRYSIERRTMNDELLLAIKELTTAVKENTIVNRQLLSAIKEESDQGEEEQPSEYLDGTPTPIIEGEQEYL